MAATCIHALHVALGYLVMMAVMNYNAWVCAAVVVGAGVGHFLFGSRLTSGSGRNDAASEHS